MTTTARRRSSVRVRAGRRLLAVLAIAAVSIGCVADTTGSGAGTTAGAGTTDPGGAPTPTPAPAGPVSSPSLAPPLGLGPVPLPAPTPTAMPAGARATVPILYYHRVQAIPAAFPTWSAAHRQQFLTYDVIPAAFSAQLDWLLEHGFTTILPRDLVAHWDHGAPLPARPVIITFDDGSRDWVRNVLPILKAHGMVAEFYLTLDAIEHGNLTWPEVRRLAAAGNGVGAHDVHHVQLAGLGSGRASAPAATMASEVGEAYRIIGLNVGVMPDSMAYVGGGVDAALEQAVKDAGYTSARGIVRGIVQAQATRYRMRVVRIGMHDDVSDLLLGTLVAGLPTFEARLNGVSDKTSD